MVAETQNWDDWELFEMEKHGDKDPLVGLNGYHFFG